jgi:uncharacterized protein YuzE
MENIKIYDNYLTKEDMKILLEKIHLFQWKYGHSSGKEIEKIDNRFFSFFSNDFFFIEYLKQKIENTIQSFFSNKCWIQLNRHYMHIQTFGQDGSYHVDNLDSNTYTFCLYITDIKDNDMEFANGDFLIKIPNKKEIICIETLQNRGLLFPSHYWHKGMAYNCHFSEKRLCLTWKLEIISKK